MRRHKFRLVRATCPRCGVSVITGNRSLTGADATKAHFGPICTDCTTPEEGDTMLQAQAGAILRGGK